MARFKILIADNTEAYRAGLIKLLERRYDIIEAVDPQDAEAKLNEEFVHLAIVDLRLQRDSLEVDKSGLDLCEKMSEFIPRIIITAYPNHWEIVRRALQSTSNRRQPIAADVFSKLADKPEQLLEKISDLLSSEYDIPCVRRIGVLTSGGDSPGMNMAISAITRFAMNRNVEVIGIEDGYEGLMEGRGFKIRWPYVSRVLGGQGTFLKTSRPKAFKQPTERRKAFDFLKKNHISGLVIIGGDGSMKGAAALAEDFTREHRTLQTVGIPGTIDNDLYGTDMSLGTASAVNEIIGELSNMIEIAVGLRRIFVVEVMGAKAGYLALEAAVAFGADAVLIPERIIVVDEGAEDGVESWEEHVDYVRSRRKLDDELKRISKHLERVFASDKRYAFVIVAEGIFKSTEKIVKKIGGPNADYPQLDVDYVIKELERLVMEDWGANYRLDVRKQVLGYPVRGPRPCRFDLWLGATLGKAAVERLLDDDKAGLMVGWEQQGGRVVETAYDDVVRESNKPPRDVWTQRKQLRGLWDLHESLSHNLPTEEVVVTEYWTFAEE